MFLFNNLKVIDAASLLDTQLLAATASLSQRELDLARTRQLLLEEQRAARSLMSAAIAEEMLILRILDLGGRHAGSGIRGADRAAHAAALAAAKGAAPGARDPAVVFSLERKRQAAALKEQYLAAQQRDAAGFVASNERHRAVIANRQGMLKHRLQALEQQYSEVVARARAAEDEASALDEVLRGLVAERERWREAKVGAQEALEENEVKVRLLWQ